MKKMKKNIIALFTASSMIISGAAAFAEATPAPADNEEVFISDNLETSAPVSIPSYIKNTVTVTNTEDGKIETKTDGEAENEKDNVINFNIKDTTVVFDLSGEKKTLEDIEKDSVITVYTGAYEPAPLILPPLYTANVIIIEDESSVGFTDVDTYLKDEGDMLVNAANTLAINVDKNTKIVDKDNNALNDEDFVNKDLIVFYGESTRSIPAQTTPDKVVVLGENELALSNIEAAKNEETAPEAAADPESTEVPAADITPSETAEPEEGIAVDFTKIKSIKVEDKVIENIYVKEGTLMLPVRAIAEAMGMSVSWDGEMRAVMLNDGMYSLKIGENSYIAGKMTPAQLECAPEITNDLTYVPFDYFTEIMQKSWNVDLDNNAMELTDTPAATEIPVVTEVPEAPADPEATEAPSEEPAK